MKARELARLLLQEPEAQVLAVLLDEQGIAVSKVLPFEFNPLDIEIIPDPSGGRPVVVLHVKF